MNFRVKNVVPQLMSYQQFAKKKTILRSICLYFWNISQMIRTYIYMLNASVKTWINENDIVEELPYKDMTCRGKQYKFDSELWLVN